MKIYLHDLIGTHSGVHYYLNTFAKKIKKHNIDVSIKSNYSSNNNISYYPFLFRGGLIKKLFLLSYSYAKFFLAICKLKKNEIIIVSLYGTYVDFGLLMISKISSKNVLLDVHEIVDENFIGLTLRRLFIYGFKVCENPIITHSKKVTANLQLNDYKNKVIQTPHIHYEIDKSCNLKNVMDDVKKSFEDGFTYFLFFGNIIPSKGIFELLSTIEKIDFNNSKIRIIIAGKDRLNCIKDYSNYEEISQKSILLLKHINDDEMNYLFNKSDYLLLPYQDIAQSGVLEMAINFRKPILSSNIKYFKDKFSKYPSFGKPLDTNDAINFAKAIESEAKKLNQFNFYKDEDLENYFNPNIFNNFISEIIKFLK
jgi:glycosyltransferase involved in cell wall biosynthesis